VVSNSQKVAKGKENYPEKKGAPQKLGTWLELDRANGGVQNCGKKRQYTRHKVTKILKSFIVKEKKN